MHPIALRDLKSLVSYFPEQWHQVCWNVLNVGATAIIDGLKKLAMVTIPKSNRQMP